MDGPILPIIWLQTEVIKLHPKFKPFFQGKGEYIIRDAKQVEKDDPTLKMETLKQSADVVVVEHYFSTLAMLTKLIFIRQTILTP